jgi:hypothetical protein
MCQREIVVPLPGPAKPKAYLKHFAFKPPLWVHGATISLLAVTVLAVVLGFTLHGRYRGVEVKGSDVALTVASLGALLIGYWQWRMARHEISMDKYYDRLDLANRRQDGDQTSVRDMMKPSHPELSEESPEILMYVYAELDNLEYVVEKYRLGYMNEEQACRGLRTFQLRCWSPQFRCITRHRVHSGDYNSGTARVVDRVCEGIRQLTSHEYVNGGAGQARQVAGTAATTPRRRASDGSPISSVPNPQAGPPTPLTTSRGGDPLRSRASDKYPSPVSDSPLTNPESLSASPPNPLTPAEPTVSSNAAG